MQSLYNRLANAINYEAASAVAGLDAMATAPSEFVTLAGCSVHASSYRHKVLCTGTDVFTEHCSATVESVQFGYRLLWCASFTLGQRTAHFKCTSVKTIDNIGTQLVIGISGIHHRLKTF